MTSTELTKVHELQRRVIEIAQALIDRKTRELQEGQAMGACLIAIQKLIDDLKRGQVTT